MEQPTIPLTTAEAARVLDVVPATVRLMERRGELRAIRTVSGQRLFQAEDVYRLKADRDAMRAAREPESGRAD